MSQIELKVPSDDPIVLRAMAKALEEIAVARDASAQSASFPQLFKYCASKAIDKAVADGFITKQAEVDTTSQHVESLATHIITSQKKVGDLVDLGDGNFSQGYRLEVEELTTTDSTGTQWDERIHSASKALNGDGTWRVRRKPKDTDEVEWAAYVDSVKKELDTLCKDEGCDHHGTLHVCVRGDEENRKGPFYYSHPESDSVGKVDTIQELHNVLDDGLTHEITCDEYESSLNSSVAVPPPPPPAPMKFAEVMTFLTSRTGKITTEQINQVIKDMGLSSIAELNTKPEHIQPFVTRVKALLGE